jgi:hypothetical protein
VLAVLAYPSHTIQPQAATSARAVPNWQICARIALSLPD